MVYYCSSVVTSVQEKRALREFFSLGLMIDVRQGFDSDWRSFSSSEGELPMEPNAEMISDACQPFHLSFLRPNSPFPARR